jgi:hypothetical protein
MNEVQHWQHEGLVKKNVVARCNLPVARLTESHSKVVESGIGFVPCVTYKFSG